MSICRLCCKEKRLIKSHIIPEFMYKDLFNKHHKINKFSPQEFSQGQMRVSRPSSGEYERGLLCENCDNDIIGPYESYASKAIFGGPFNTKECPTCESSVNQDDIEFTKCENINYKKFKLFLLSILWRASISSRPFFEQVQLGPHEERLRKMLNNGFPGRQGEYPIFTMAILRSNKNLKDLIGQPRALKKDGRRMYSFLIGGIIYTYHISNHQIPKYFKDHTIRPSNEIDIIHMPTNMIGKFFKEHFGLDQSLKGI